MKDWRGWAEAYLARYGYGNNFGLYSSRVATSAAIRQAVIIPALAERDSIFATLASLAANAKNELNHTAVICVINNDAAADATSAIFADNQETLAIFQRIINGDAALAASLGVTAITANLICVDASSAGFALAQDKAGVGLARKLGMDLAIGLFNYQDVGAPLLFSLDADTIVQSDYLASARSCLSARRSAMGIFSFAHQPGDNEFLQDAINIYEIFLRYYVGMLSYAGSPYAFHTIGSTIVCKASAYLAARGMPARKAGEDFYFLNKLAKLGDVKKILTSCVFPAARQSARTPFGTGRKLLNCTGDVHSVAQFYNPQAFSILKEFLELVNVTRICNFRTLAREAQKIHEGLADFLISNGFPSAWEKICANSKSDQQLTSQFHHWFDAFRTFKLIRSLTVSHFPPLEIATALEVLFERFLISSYPNPQTPSGREALLAMMRQNPAFS